MVPRSKRVFYLFISTVIVVCCFACASEWQSRHNYPKTFDFWFLDLIGASILGFFWSLLGWILAIPLIMVVSNLRGWRFVGYLVVGSGIGPITILALGLMKGELPDMWPVKAAAVISFLTALIYLILFWRAQSALVQSEVAMSQEEMKSLE
jgi:hypothetical protein